MVWTRDEGRGRSVLKWTVKTVGIVGLLSYFATNWLAGPGLDSGTVGRLASAIARGTDDPVTTGSILGNASSTRIDPCVAPRRH